MTLAGTPLKIAVVDDKARVENANILLTDIDASNGVIHVIDRVMIPWSSRPELIEPLPARGAPRAGATPGVPYHTPHKKDRIP